MSENSDSSKMTIDGNETLPSGEMKEASSGERNSLTKNYSPGVFFRELKELTTSDLNKAGYEWAFNATQGDKDLLEAMSTNEIRTIVRESKRDSAHRENYDCDKDWEVLQSIQQLIFREKERWHKEQSGL